MAKVSESKNKITSVKKFTTIEELEKSAIGPVYVLNNSHESLEGNIIISIPKKNGNGADLVKVPKTFIPIDVTQQVARDQLLQGSEFRKTVQKRLIKILTAEYASLLLSTEEAKSETKRLHNESQIAKTAMRKAGVVEETEEDDEDEYVEINEVAKEVKKQAKKKVKEPSLKVQNIVNKAKRDDLGEIAILTELRNVSRMTKADLAFLSKQYESRPRIIKFLRTKLAEIRKAEAEADED